MQYILFVILSFLIGTILFYLSNNKCEPFTIGNDIQISQALNLNTSNICNLFFPSYIYINISGIDENLDLSCKFNGTYTLELFDNPILNNRINIFEIKKKINSVTKLSSEIEPIIYRKLKAIGGNINFHQRINGIKFPININYSYIFSIMLFHCFAYNSYELRIYPKEEISEDDLTKIMKDVFKGTNYIQCLNNILNSLYFIIKISIQNSIIWNSDIKEKPSNYINIK